MALDEVRREWLELLVERYPEVERVYLAGSRAQGTSKPESDWDFLICLDEHCYDSDDVAQDKLEQRITFDPDLERPEWLDLFFITPGGRLIRWQFGPNGQPPITGGDEYLDACYRTGVPPGAWDRFIKELAKAKLVYERP